MNSRRIAYIFMTLSFIMIVSGSVSCFVLGLQKDRKETYRRMYVVNDEFEMFSTNTSGFEEYRDNLYRDVFSNFYFDQMYQNDSMVKEKLSHYEHIVDEVYKNVNRLNSVCKNVYYPNSEANSKCLNYKNIYEQIVNYFVSDIHLYNHYVKQYNNSLNSLDSSKIIQKYSTEKIYIDYNQDQKYDGKDEE